MPAAIYSEHSGQTAMRGSNKMNGKKYQPLRKKSMRKKISMTCIVMLIHALPIFSLQMDLDVHMGDANLKHSIVLKTTGGKGE